MSDNPKNVKGDRNAKGDRPLFHRPLFDKEI